MTSVLTASAAAIAVSLAALTFGAGSAVAAGGGVDPFFSQVLATPDDPAVNLAYAQRAEDRGEYRKALAAYERVLAADPDHPEASAALVRVRRLIEPETTQFFAEFGFGYDSNARQFPSPFEDEDGSAFAAVSVRDERRLGSMRWRTEAGLYGRLYGDTNQLNQAVLSAGIGPLVPLGNVVVLRPALVGGYSVLDGDGFYGEVGASFTLEGRYGGALQSVELRTVWRDYTSRWVSDDGFIIDLRGRFAADSVIAEGDALVLSPKLRWSDIDVRPGVLLVSTLEPGRYVEAGATLAYTVPFTDWLYAGPTVTFAQRWYKTPAFFAGPDREDTYFAPGATAVLHDLIAENVDIRVDYRFEHQNSNDPTRDFDNHAVTARIQARF